MPRYVFLLGFLMFPLLLTGQDQDERSTLLPDIDPQDIEIRGDFSARFPGLSRQPILGFNPKPRVFQMDPDRMPFIESEEDAVAGISPRDLEQPYSPQREFITYPERRELFGRLGYGSHDSPEVRLYGETSTSEKSSLSGDLDFLSTQGYQENHTSSFRYLDGRTDWVTRTNSSTFRVGLNGRSDFNYAVPGLNALQDDYTRKEYRKIGSHASFRHLNNAYNGWDVRGRYHYFSIEDNTPVDFSDEHYGSLTLNRFWDGQRIEEVFSVELHGEGSRYNTFDEQDLSWYITRFSAFYKRNLSNSNFSAGLDVYHAFDEVDEPLSLFIFPNITFQYTGLRRAEVKVNLESFVENPGLEGVHLENRQLLMSPVIDNEQGMRVTAAGSYELFRGARVFTHLKFDGYGSYAYYLLEEDGYTLHYDDDTNIFEANFGFSYDFIPQKLTLSSDVTLLQSNMSVNESVPFLETFNSTSGLYSNPFRNVYLRAWAEYRGSRPVNFEDEKLDGYFLLGAQLDLRITSNFGAYIKGLNLLNQDYEIWQGYLERPVQLYGGLTLHF